MGPQTPTTITIRHEGEDVIRRADIKEMHHQSVDMPADLESRSASIRWPICSGF
jgi:hypothetical protein